MALEYASSVWSPIASSTSINKLQVMQNAALRIATGCTQDTNIQHLHDETHTLPIHEHLQLHAPQYKQKTQHPSHPLHRWITGVCSPYVISLSDFAYSVFGQEPAVAVHLALWYVLLVCHQYDVFENYVGSVYVGGYGGLSEADFVSSVNCVQSAFL